MEINTKFNQLELLTNNLYNKKILLYGPANAETDESKIINLFDKYDFIILHNLFFDRLHKKINIDKYNIIHVLNGQYTEDNKDSIIKNNKYIYFYLVSEIHTMNVLNDYGINPSKILHMANNYRLYNFSNPPHMGPKLLLFILYYKLNFSEINITGYTFYMDFDNVNSIYNFEYIDFLPIYNTYKGTSTFEYLNNIQYDNITYDDKQKLINKAVSESFSKDNNHANVFEGWNLFLKFIFYYKDKKIKLDNKLKKLLHKYPNILLENPLY